jgi:hypothetical protein
MAVEELLREAKRGAVRASVSGPSGWKKCPLLKTNKRFLTNTLVQHMNSNRVIERHKRDDASRNKRARSPSTSGDSEHRKDNDEYKSGTAKCKRKHRDKPKEKKRKKDSHRSDKKSKKKKKKRSD